MIPLLLALLAPPRIDYAPSAVVITWEQGACAWKSYGGSAVWLGCSGRAELPERDGATVPRAGDRVWVVAPSGERSAAVEIAMPHWAMVPVVRR